MTIILRSNPKQDENEWDFTVNNLPSPRVNKKGEYHGLHISFSPDRISLDLEAFPSNRVLQNDDGNLFVLASFAALRFKDAPPSVNIDYIKRFLRAGLKLNGHQYWFYGHSNSQLRSRSCLLRRGGTEAELHQKILAMGEFGAIKNAAKLSKRIGLLFSSATIDWNLKPEYVKDVPDLEEGDVLFSDGCGLISFYLAQLLAKEKRIIFRQRRYVPSVFQIRYRGYKGVLMIHPALDDGQVHFRKSMKKFKATQNDTFSIVEHSVPYVYARLNNDIVTLLSVLGITNETLLQKLQSYLSWLTKVKNDLATALDFLSSVNQHEEVERVLLDGLDSPSIQAKLDSYLKKEIASFKKENTEKYKLRLLVHDSRYVFGVCDPFQVLEEGEVFIRVTMPRTGPRTIHSCPILVVRNPCLHPGDCLKLRAVDHPKLRHLVDCVVFASKGKQAAPSLSSGGDLDGDQYTVIWDPQLVTPKVAQHFLYPPVKEKKTDVITRQDLAAHFAGYNNVSMGVAASLHWKWVRCSPNGAMSKECQELNALYSQCVDGARIRIPDRLKRPPEPSEPFIVDEMLQVAKDFAQKWLSGEDSVKSKGDKLTDEQTIVALLLSDRVSMSEFQLLQVVLKLSERSSIDLGPYHSLMNFSALNWSEKHEICNLLSLKQENQGIVWNSLMRSDLVSPDTFKRNLSDPTLRMQRLYTTRGQGTSGFFEYLARSLEYFNRRLILLRTDDRFSVGIFIRGRVPWDEEAHINENVAVVALTPTAPQTMSLYRHTVDGYRLHCSDGHFQLYNKAIRDTWIFINRPPLESSNELQTSIALQKISAITQKNIGRINKTPVVAVEIHVVSNQDRVAQQIFDLRLDRVPTEEKLLSVPQAEPFSRNTLDTVDWSKHPEYEEFFGGNLDVVQTRLRNVSFDQLNSLMDFSLHYHADRRAFWIFEAMISSHDIMILDIAGWLLRYPHLVFTLLRCRLDADDPYLPSPFDVIRQPVLDAVILSMNDAPVAGLMALERLGSEIAELTFSQYTSLLWGASMVVRDQRTMQKTLKFLHVKRKGMEDNPEIKYAHLQALRIALERAEDAFESCPCDELGRPSRQRNPPIRIRIHPKIPRLQGPTVNTIQTDIPSMDTSDEHGGPPLNLPLVVADIRVDKPSMARLHSHVRLTAASKPESQTVLWRREILDGIIKLSFRGEVEIELFHHPPPEYAMMEWSLYDCGSTATTRAMMDAIKRLQVEKAEACAFINLLTRTNVVEDVADQEEGENMTTDGAGWEGLNESQKTAIALSFKSDLSLIWGPPGTGKTTVVVKILELLLRQLGQDSKILMTASTHNAVDNVLERFAQKNSVVQWIPDDGMVRAATDHNKVSDSVKKYTVDALIGGNPMDDRRLIKMAEKRIKEARVVFTTCAGAGLGMLRRLKFDFVLIDEASQITEGVALIPLVKGSRRAIMVGDHVQLRPTVKGMSSNISLFERLYTSPHKEGISKTMLNIQYRFPEELARFPSAQFYEGKLGTGTDTDSLQAKLLSTNFPWPREPSSGNIVPNVFIPCLALEDFGGQSKQNEGQAQLAAHIVKLLQPSDANVAVKPPLTIAILAPYSKQVQRLKSLIPYGANIHTVDGFQGREADFIIYSTVRSNLAHDIGFLTDERRLNVAWTRARVGRIVIGNPDTLKFGTARKDDDDGHQGPARPEVNKLWKEAIEDCRTVELTVPEPEK